MMRRFMLLVGMISAWAATALCQEPVSLVDAKKASGGWEFDNGREFPGAQGKLDLAAEPFRDKQIGRAHV